RSGKACCGPGSPNQPCWNRDHHMTGSSPLPFHAITTSLVSTTPSAGPAEVRRSVNARGSDQFPLTEIDQEIWSSSTLRHARYMTFPSDTRADGVLACAGATVPLSCHK